MATMQAERSATKSRPLTRSGMRHQRTVRQIRPDGSRLVGRLVYREAPDDPHAKWLVVPTACGSVIWHKVDWGDVAAGRFFSAAGGLTQEQERTLARSLRAYLADRD
ncbi:hypothetical protein [Streptomyces sp. NPDC054958]